MLLHTFKSSSFLGPDICFHALLLCWNGKHDPIAVWRIFFSAILLSHFTVFLIAHPNSSYESHREKSNSFSLMCINSRFIMDVFNMKDLVSHEYVINSLLSSLLIWIYRLFLHLLYKTNVEGWIMYTSWHPVTSLVYFIA